MFRNAFAFVVVASALAFTGCSKCSEQPVAAPPAAVEAPAAATPAPAVEGAAAPAVDAAAPAAPVDAAPVAEPTPAGK